MKNAMQYIVDEHGEKTAVIVPFHNLGKDEFRL